MSPRQLLRSACRLALPLVALAATVVQPPLAVGAASANTIKNPGCESNADGWGAWQGTVARTTAVAKEGRAACQVTYGGSGGAYTLDDSPATVANPPARGLYRAYAQVRTDKAVGRPLQLVLRQSGGAKPLASVASAPVRLSTAWQQVSAKVTIDAADRSTLELYLSQTDAQPGDSFQADVIVLVPDANNPQPIQTDPPPTDGGAPSDSISALNEKTYDGALFASSSPWNTRAGGSPDRNNAAMIADLGASFADHGGISVNTNRYGVPMFYADASTPRVKVGHSTSWWPGFTSAPIPPQATPDPGSDHHLVVWDIPNHTLYEYWDMTKGSGGWSAGYGVMFDSRGQGYQDGLWKGGARAYGGSLAAGTIRYSEVKAGLIPHAIAMAYPTVRGDAYAGGASGNGIWGIASHNDNYTDPSLHTAGNIPEGARLRLKASVDVNARCGNNRGCKIIGRALQDYGSFMVDHAGAPVLFAENLSGKSVSWDGVMDAWDTRAFRADDFEVLTLPTLTSSGAR